MDQASLGMLIGRASKAMRQFLELQLKPCGVTLMQYRAILVLHSNQGGDFSQKDLERALMLRGSTVNGIVDRLEEKGLLIRQPSATDGRRNNLLLTPLGLQVHRQFEAIVRRAEDSMLDGFSSEEINQLSTYLHRIIGNLEDEGEKHSYDR